MRFLNNIEIGATPAFTLPLVDGSANQVLKTNGSGTVSWATDASGSGGDGNDFTTGAAFNTSTGVITLTIANQTAVTVDIDGRFLTGETHTIQGYLTDVATYGTANLIATHSGTADTLDYASDGTYYLYSDGEELAIANDSTWAARTTNGGVSPKYFAALNPTGTSLGASPSFVAGEEVFSIKSPTNSTYVSVRNANNWSSYTSVGSAVTNEGGFQMHFDAQYHNSEWGETSGASAAKNWSIGTVNNDTVRDLNDPPDARLDFTNGNNGQWRFSQSVSDKPYMFYWGNGSAFGNVSNKHTTLGVRMDPSSIGVDGTNNPSLPNYRFLDDPNTGMYLAATGQTAFTSGGTKTLSIPTATGSNGQVLTTNGSGTASWTTVSGGGTSYTAGSGLDLNGTEFSVEADLRDGITHIGLDTTDYISFTNNARIDFFINGGNRARLEADGDFHADGDIIAFSTTVSDARLKRDVETIQSASKKVSQLRGVEYTWKSGSREGQREIGLIAQEVEAVVPSIVREKKLSLVDGETYKTVDYEKLVALLIESNKEQQEIIAQLEERVVSLENI